MNSKRRIALLARPQPCLNARRGSELGPGTGKQ
jgi:hypothetical protein